MGGENLKEVLKSALKKAKVTLKNGDILVVASKVVSYAEKRLVPCKNRAALKKLVRSQADRVLFEGGMVLTLKNNILIPNAGIDQSNTPQGQAILWPKDAFKSARALHKALQKTFRLQKLGIVIADSHCQPLRLGTSGIAIGWHGFEGVSDERGKKDLFGKPMRYTRMAVADDLASAAGLLMGETDASIPFVLVRGFKASFTSKTFHAKNYFITPRQCLYRPLYTKLLTK